MAEFASLADVKAHLNKASNVDDSELTLHLDAAEDIVRGLVGSFQSTAVAEAVAVVGGTALLSGRPVGEVTVADYDGVAIEGFTISADAGLLKGLPWDYRPITVTYTTGTDSVPASVTLGTALIAAHLWETQRGNGPGALALQDPTADPTAFAGVASYAIPNRAKELLEPYVRRSQVA